MPAPSSRHISCRRLTSQDFEELLALYERVIRESIDTEILREHAPSLADYLMKSLKDPGSANVTRLGICVEKTLAGSALLTLSPSSITPHRAVLSDLAVLPELRGRCIGSRLLDEVNLQAVHNGRELIVTRVLAQSGTHDFLARRGWIEAGTWSRTVRLTQLSRGNQVMLQRKLYLPENSQPAP